MGPYHYTVSCPYTTIYKPRFTIILDSVYVDWPHHLYPRGCHLTISSTNLRKEKTSIFVLGGVKFFRR